MFRKNFSRFRKALLPILGVLLLVVIVGLVIPGESKANIFADGFISVVGSFGGKILELLGSLLGLLIEMTIKIFRFNNFVNMKAPPAVHIGWTIVRDLSNMMFIVILIVIAFGTIMKIQAYHARSLLTKMIIMIILINFSKTITGMFVDFSQVIMLTFVDSFSASAPIVLTIGLNLNQMVSFAKETDGNLGVVSVLVAIFLANGMLVVAIAVILAMLVILIYRILNIWILVILSPVAYVASVLPNTSRYASRWWSELGKNLSSGPILAFFLWLSLSIISTSAGAPIDLSDPDIGGITNGPISDELDDTELPKGASAIMNTQNMFNYIITIALLLTGIMLTQELGVMGGSTIGKFPGMVKKLGMGALTKPFTKGSQAWAWGSRKIRADGIGKKGRLKGIDFNPANVLRTMKAGYARKREQEEGRGAVSSGERLEKGGVQGAVFGAGAQSWVDNYAQGFMYRHGIKKLKRGGAGTITDMAADKDRKEKEYKRLSDMSSQQNTTDAYQEVAREDMADAQGEVMSIDAEISGIDAQIKAVDAAPDKAKALEEEANNIVKEDGGIIATGNLTPEIVKRLTAEAKKLRFNAAKEGGDPDLEERADAIDQRIKENKLSPEEARQLESDAETKRAEAKRLRAAAIAFDKDAAVKEKTRLETEKGQITDDRITPVKQGLENFENMQDDPPDPNTGEVKTAEQKKLEQAKAYLIAQAESKRKAREALMAGGLTEDQKKARKGRMDEFDKRIKKYNLDIDKKKALGDTEGANLMRKQLKALEALKDELGKKDDNGNIVYTPATDKEREASQPSIVALQKDEDGLRETANREFMDEEQRDRYRGEAEKAKKAYQDADKAFKKESAYRPIDFLANLARRSQTSEASRKIDTTNENELVALMENAMVRGNVTDAAAVAMQAAQVGHLNEVVMEHRAKDNWYESVDGTLSNIETAGSKLVFAVGQSMSAGVEGLHVFINEVFQKQLGYNKQAALALESDLSGAAEHGGHWTFGQAIGSNPDGQFYQRSRMEQGSRVKVERSKRDAEGLHRQGNRLAITTERWKDDKDHSKGREGILNEYAISELENWPAMTYVAERKRFNASAATHIMKYNMPVINAIRKKVYAENNLNQINAFETFIKNLSTIAAKEDPGDGSSNVSPEGEIRALQEKLIQWGLSR